MATYAELRTALGDQPLKDKVEIALLVVVDKVMRGQDTAAPFDQTNNANRRVWAARIMNDPDGAPKESAKFMPIVIAANRTATLAVILGASDAAVQTNIEEQVDLFADGT